MPESWNTRETGVRLPERVRSLRSVLFQTAALMGLWLLFSGHYDLFHISLGIVSVLLILALNRNLNRVRLYPGDVHRDLRPFRVFLYAFWLLKEIVLAALQVARIVLDPKLPVDPSLLEFHAELPNAGSQTILANSITLTPGTLTVDISEGAFLVHAFTDLSSTGLVEGVMPARVAALYGGDETGRVSHVSIRKSGEA
ncbi:MAG: Na+/H+ antiporter subunit E [bacterium]